MDQPKLTNVYEKIVNFSIKNINFYVLCIITFVQSFPNSANLLLILVQINTANLLFFHLPICFWA